MAGRSARGDGHVQPDRAGLFLVSADDVSSRHTGRSGHRLISAIGSSGGFFGPALIGWLKQSTGSDAGAFLGIGGIALVGGLVLISMRQSPVFRSRRASMREPTAALRT